MTGSEPRRTPKWLVALIIVAAGFAGLVMVAAVAMPAFSLHLLNKAHEMPAYDLTLKVTGKQWNWTYEYPDQNIPPFTSAMLTEEAAKARGEPFRLATDRPVVVPVGKVIRVQLTSADVVHAWGLPAFGVILDATPGRVNETWFKAEKTGVYYGQCRQVCGDGHAFMPVEIRVVSQAQFDAWVAGKR